MKTAEEWTQQALKDTGELLCNADYYRKWAAEIQLDAKISALEEAAEVLKQTEVEGGSHWCVREEAVKAILSLATKLKEGTK